MKRLRVFSLISCFVMSVCLTSSFPGISIADATPKTRMENCISCCSGKYLTCINLNPDRRLCAAEREPCVATCDSEGSSPSEWSDCWTQAKDDEP